MDRRADEDGPGRGVLRLRISRRMQDGDRAAGRRFRREIYEGWALGVEGDRRSDAGVPVADRPLVRSRGPADPGSAGPFPNRRVSRFETSNRATSGRLCASDTFFRNINWETALKRIEAARSDQPPPNEDPA